MSTATVSDAPAIAADLGRIVGPSQVKVRPATLVPYRPDATFGFSGIPWAVVRPGSVEAVSRIRAWANQRTVPVRPRGAGTSLAAGPVRIHGGIVLALTRMNRTMSIDPVDRTAVARPGVTTQDRARAAGEHGLHYPPDPGSQRVSRLGGNVATNVGGLHGLRYGNTGGYVLGVPAVLVDGEVIRAGGRLLKDVAGYDLVCLLTGSEGTLAVPTELTLALRRAPAASSTGLAYFADLESARDAVRGAGDCCRAAGTYAILRPRDRMRVLAAKLGALADLDLDFLVVVNPGCQRQLTTAISRARLRTKVVHLAEFVASARADHR